jgi:copper chaperone CopZ
MPAKYQITSLIPGRLRLKIPQLRYDLDYGIRLEALVESVLGITEVELKTAASSLTVHYDTNQLSQSQLLQKIGTIIEQASSEEKLGTLFLEVPGYKCLNLNTYEYSQVLAFRQWRCQDPGFWAAFSKKLFSPLEAMVKKNIPKSTLKQMIDVLEHFTDEWSQEWESLKPKAGLEDYRQLKKVSLKQCDLLVEQVQQEALAATILEGAITSIFGILGEMANIAWLIDKALKTTQKIGLCYGYSPLTFWQKHFIWLIIAMATAITKEEREAALANLHNCQKVFCKVTIEDVMEESVIGTLEEDMVETMIERIMQNLFEEDSAGELVPLVGAGIDITADRQTIKEVSIAAQKAFQLRWLLENKKIEWLPLTRQI